MLPLTKRQREILDYLNEFIAQHGYAPSLEEIGRKFGLSSLATVHKHLTNLQEKDLTKRGRNRTASAERGARGTCSPLPPPPPCRSKRLRRTKPSPCPRISSASATPTCSASAATR